MQLQNMDNIIDWNNKMFIRANGYITNDNIIVCDNDEIHNNSIVAVQTDEIWQLAICYQTY